MNKKLVAVAIAAAVAAPAAMANDTTLYGKVHMSINNSDTNDAWNVSNHSSRLGIKGSEDLGNGLKAIFQYEMSYSGVDSSTAIGSARNSYIGLAGDFGQVRVGRHDTPNKVAFYAAGNERLADSIIDLNSNFGFQELRTSNAIAYISPSFSGLTVAAAVVPGEAVGQGPLTPVTDADGIADAYSVGVMYSGGGLKASVGYTDGSDLTGLSDATLLNVGATYTMDNFSIGGQYQETEASPALADKESWVITGTAGFGNNTLIVMYGNSEADGIGDADTLGLAVSHKMSKRTSAYVAYRNTDDNVVPSQWIGNGGTTAGGDAFGVGMIHTF
jgi:predicted porin